MKVKPEGIRIEETPTVLAKISGALIVSAFPTLAANDCLYAKLPSGVVEPLEIVLEAENGKEMARIVVSGTDIEVQDLSNGRTKHLRWE